MFDEWVDGVAKELGVEEEFDVDAILDLARVAAHEVERRAAPVTTYLVGLAVGRGADPDATFKRIEEMASAL
ncbi:MAG: DUF6457 domain-containing protein [Actinomycetota bacterium]|nr:DUF6457 domain-containing protein [Actinomycetota bacterium]